MSNWQNDPWLSCVFADKTAIRLLFAPQRTDLETSTWPADQRRRRGAEGGFGAPVASPKEGRAHNPALVETKLCEVGYLAERKMNPLQNWKVIVAALLVNTACIAEDPTVPLAPDELPAASSQGIIGGVDETGRPEVVMLQLPAGLCSGTLIEDEVVLTAAHCVAGQVRAGNTGSGSVLFGTGFGDRDAVRIGVRDIAMHRRYSDAIGFGLPYDIAAVRLEEPAPSNIPAAVFNDRPVDPELFEGDQILAVGFGNDDGQTGTGAGLKRRAFLPIVRIFDNRIRSGNDNVNTCQGDSGGPGFLTIDGVERVAGITSSGPIGCGGVSTMNRVDSYVDDFLYEVVDAWSGPCASDGVCNETCPRTPDPDCDVCGFNGTCGEDCPQQDRDCPIAGFSGDSCEDDDDCESRLCIESPEDPRVKYCSDPCDASVEASFECENPLTRCADVQDGEGVCRFGGTTPGVLGADCNTGSQCRSGLCDIENNLCAEPCSSDTECGEGFACESVASGKVCRLPSPGGCSVTGRGPAGFAGLAMLVAAVVLARRRRRV